MPDPSEKSPQVEKFLEENYGRTTAIEASRCIPAPVGCGRVVQMTVDSEWEDRTKPWPYTWFRDALSMKEYSISGLCQTCQDTMWPPDEDEH